MNNLMGKSASRWVLGFVVAAVGLRFLPHAWNVTPLIALALFSGAHLRSRNALWVLMAAIMFSDLIIGIHITIPFTWGCFALVYFLSRKLDLTNYPKRSIYGSLLGSTLFYLITNLGVFLVRDFYPKTWEGLIQCYVVAIPFFRNALIGDLIYTTVIFGLHALIISRLSAVKA